MSREQRDFRILIKESLRDNNALIADYKQIVLNIRREGYVSNSNLELLMSVKYSLESIKNDIETYTDEGYFDGDDYMIFEIPEIEEQCIGNTKSDLETIVLSYYDYVVKIDEYIDTNEVERLYY